MSAHQPAPSPGQMTTEERTRRELERHHYETVGDYPGSPDAVWHVRCQLCDAELWVSPADMFNRPVRRACYHRTRTIIVPARERRERAAAVAAMKRRTKP